MQAMAGFGSGSAEGLNTAALVVPGIYGFQTIMLLNQGDMLAAMQAAALGGFIVGAMSLGLTASRFITERRWLIES